MLKIKSQFEQPEQPRFNDVGMRRLMGALEELKISTQTAYSRLYEKSMNNPHAGLQDILEDGGSLGDGSLVRLLENTLGTDWQKYVTGSVI